MSQSSRSLTAYSDNTINKSNHKLKRTPKKIRSPPPTPPPPTVLPKPSPTLPDRLKKSSTARTITPIKQTLHASLSQDGLDNGQRRLNQYLLLKTIGRGSFGTVELAQDTSASSSTADAEIKLYAIKEYSKSRMRKRARTLRRPPNQGKSRTLDDSILPAEASEGILLVKQEVAIMKKLSHPNIVSLLEVIDTDQDSLFFVLELCPYGPVMQIHQHQATTPLSERSARNVFRQIILGIQYLHFNQVIHRDIKPDNILYFQDPQTTTNPLCKIVDFGVSESFAKPGDPLSSDRMHKSAGSPAFLALFFVGEGVHGRITDIWAMGITLYALVCGKLPFESFNQIALCEKIINDSPEFPTQLSDSLVQVLQGLLNKDPEKRIRMNELRVASWVTEEGTQPLDTRGLNLRRITPPTEREIAEAFSLRTIATMMKAIGKFRAIRRGRASQATCSSTEDMGGGSSSTSSSPACSPLSILVSTDNSCLPLSLSPRHHLLVVSVCVCGAVTVGEG
ncbi:hypothetical protein VP01_1308g1 [Puccinia sorghi]|uniref:Protein kinase domain-containing protein n=1 Tax=Puccinia sorghi TaxID=27349 RepID=A0A0L6VN09_9BASI|nr:hypothetical protein VP01_1308g1 [Puccinia sorghi]